MFKRTISLLFLSALCGSSIAAERVEGPVGARVERVIDGDTIEVTANPWPSLRVKTRVRIDSIDTPEIRGKCPQEIAQAKKAHDQLKTWLAEGVVLLSNIRPGKYAGRVVARVQMPDGRDVGDEMVRIGLARAYHGKKKRESWCNTTIKRQ